MAVTIAWQPSQVSRRGGTRPLANKGWRKQEQVKASGSASTRFSCSRFKPEAGQYKLTTAESKSDLSPPQLIHECLEQENDKRPGRSPVTRQPCSSQLFARNLCCESHSKQHDSHVASFQNRRYSVSTMGGRESMKAFDGSRCRSTAANNLNTGREKVKVQS